MVQRGSGYEGGEGTSAANQQILTFPTDWTRCEFYEFSFVNTQKCNVKINGKDRLIPCPAGVGFAIDASDAPIKSFVVVEAGIEFTWRGKY